jgi:hypothetical protein
MWYFALIESDKMQIDNISDHKIYWTFKGQIKLKLNVKKLTQENFFIWIELTVFLKSSQAIEIDELKILQKLNCNKKNNDEKFNAG